ncbi:DUF3048 domain-containing protein [Salipaludibacillus sp. CUR1]|uniref:DUF3048 domain-containing protein n=1 Tax=Salipaludibacillus sp. CUR1 TaxID=2820003 RepID=UPI001E4251BA|nr:DUF3048 domain-containing protein [Salipaludibacillus sp. CUR1]MCE7792558.1 DUF3048 domain-containing protein [Salipaludibacillus sp. CUR1]
MNLPKVILPVIAIALLAVFIFFMGNEEEIIDEPNTAEGSDEQNEADADPEENEMIEYSGSFPLTGIKTDEKADHRAFGVMIENSASARPQSGLYQADVVYEVLSEGRITRLLAFFHSQKPDRIGPVRSARDYYIYLNNGYDAIYASAGGSPGAFDLFEQGAVDVISALDYDGTFFKRASGRSAPHNVYTSYDDLMEASDHIGLHFKERRPPELPFSGEPEEPDQEAAVIGVSYNSSVNDVQFTYDEGAGGYIRSVGAERTDDLETNEPVAPRNVFIVEASHRVVDDQGRRDIDIESGGSAYLIHDGGAVEAEWKNVGGVIFPFKDGEPLNFLPGQTWINLVEDIDDVSFGDAS